LCDASGAFIGSFEEARQLNVRLRVGDRAEWERVVALLKQNGVAPVQGVLVNAYGFCASQVDMTSVESAPVRARAALLEQLRRARARGEGEAEGTQVWLDRLMDTFDVEDSVPQEKPRGAWDAAADARGAHVVTFLDSNGRFTASGGEAAYLQSQRVSREGFAEGWEKRWRLFFERYGMDAEGYLSRLPGHERIGERELGVLPPALQLLARARHALWGVPVIELGLGGKRKHTHVALDVAAAAFEQVAAIQFKYGITAAYSGDASRDVKRDDKGVVQFDENGPVQLVTFATAHHSGRVSAGTMVEPEGEDNYLGELGAVLAALAAEQAGGRILIILDATSPIRAWLKYRRKHHRTQMGYYGAELLDTLEQLVARQEVVVFLWQTSHVGAPANEWADVLAGEAMAKEQADKGRRLAIPRLPVRFCAQRPARPSRSVFAWASGLASEAVSERLQAFVGETALFDGEKHLKLGAMARGLGSTARAVCAQRLVAGDRRKRWGAHAEAIIAQSGCAYGCACRGTWSHYAFFCGGEEPRLHRWNWHAAVVQFRAVVEPAVGEAEGEWLADVLGEGGQGASKFESSLQLLEELTRCGEGAAGELASDLPEAREGLLAPVRGLAGGLVTRPSQSKEATGGGRPPPRAVVVQGARRMVGAGLALLAQAKKAERQLAEDLREAGEQRRCQLKHLAAWREVALRSGRGGGKRCVAA
jgi:Ribonuclease HI